MAPKRKETGMPEIKIVKPGTILIAEVNLKTHTRWIRDRNPLNIYRYSDFIYNLSRFSGSPNRLRPADYEDILRENGWINIKILPLTILEKEYLTKVRPTLNSRFRVKEKINQMDYLSMVIGAEKH